MPRNHVAIYTPTASGLYEDAEDRPVAGAERQTGLLASMLADLGLRVAHVVFPVERLRPPASARLTVVQRPQLSGPPRLRRRSRETWHLWRALARADAEVYVVRMGSAALGAAGLFCRLRRRKLVYATANDMDLTMGYLVGSRARVLAYQVGVRLADAVVVQTEAQVRLAREELGRVRGLVTIPSFGEAPVDTGAGPEAFVWIGRLVTEKRPLEYLALAEALPDARFRMIGWETQQTPPELAAEVRERAAGIPNLELLPSQPRERALELICRAVAVVSVSEAEGEGMPNAFLEAWARGVPVLTLDFDPDGRVRAHGLGVAAGGSREALVEGARRLWEERDRRDDLARRVRDYVAATHAPEAVAARWLDLVRDLSGNGRHGAAAG